MMVRDLSGKHPNYYEAILQLRDCSPEVDGLVIKDLAKSGVKVVKKVKVKGGLDYYLADSDFAKGMGRKLQERFGGEMKVTASLWGKKEGNEVYRLTVLFRAVGFKKGDLVEYGGEEYKVKMMTKKDIMLQQVKTGEKVHVRYREMEKIKKK